MTRSGDRYSISPFTRLHLHEFTLIPLKKIYIVHIRHQMHKFKIFKGKMETITRVNGGITAFALKTGPISINIQLANFLKISY